MIAMQLEEIRKLKQHIHQIAAKYSISEVYVFGSVASGESNEVSDVDFLIEMEDGVSAFGVGAFQFEVQKLLGTHIDVVPTFALPKADDNIFAQSILAEAVSL